MSQPQPDPPLALLAELTHLCPLQCPYCSNPQALLSPREELSTAEWKRVIAEAAALGVLQIHFSGGEPMVRRDLEDLVAHARAAGLYSNLITSGVLPGADRLPALAQAGLDHVQLSFQDAEAGSAERIGNLPGAQAKKMAFAAEVRAAGLPLTLNAVVHRQNLARLEEIIELALSLGAGRLEIAHVQYYGWALQNRGALMPSRSQIEAAAQIVEQARQRFKGHLVIDHVTPDYFARRPKACMGGWGRQFLNIAPDGKVLPCHAAQTISDLVFDSVKDLPLAEIWRASSAFKRFRGTGWMPEPCRSCERREIDWGGCRCQALALTGRADAVDPACELSPDHGMIVSLAESESAKAGAAFTYRRYAPRSVQEQVAAAPGSKG
jgi:pyrroloquinoline quinone biosynthesis protein E